MITIRNVLVATDFNLAAIVGEDGYRDAKA